MSSFWFVFKSHYIMEFWFSCTAYSLGRRAKQAIERDSQSQFMIFFNTNKKNAWKIILFYTYSQSYVACDWIRRVYFAYDIHQSIEFLCAPSIHIYCVLCACVCGIFKNINVKIKQNERWWWRKNYEGHNFMRYFHR